MSNQNFDEEDNPEDVTEIHSGLELSTPSDIVQVLDEARTNSYEFIAVPLAHTKQNERYLLGTIEPTNQNARSDTLLNASQWTEAVVGIVSPSIQLDSHMDDNRKKSEKELLQELSWASHLSLPAVLLPTPSVNCANFAQSITGSLSSSMYMQFWVRIPLMSMEQSKLDDENTDNNQKAIENAKGIDPWEWWNTLRVLCDHHPSLSVGNLIMFLNVTSPALEITEDVPSSSVLARWIGEPIKCVILPTSIFLTNKAGYPTLSKRHQQFVAQLFKLRNLRFLVKGASQKTNTSVYVQYLKYLYSKNRPFDALQQQEIPYLDYLQMPLQPLMDNLESQTYETFERDKTKYDQYQKAVYKALINKKNTNTNNFVIMVVGAGRGPLVRASMRAATEAQANAKIYAVEKNPNAVLTLNSLKVALKWGEQVTIVDSDMRVWNAPEKADILVSELLGSFGDNELSPECLDGVQRFLKDDGVSIPTSYTSFLAPLSSSKLFNEVRNCKEQKYFEMGFVVRLNNVFILDSPQEGFTFVHPNRQLTIDNSRYKKFQFKATESAMIHGFAGYFDSLLYEDVHLSILPKTHTPKMFSWFPIFFPIKEPMYVSAGETIEVHFWRKCNRVKVWYEWTVTKPHATTIHNILGRSHFIGL